MYFNKRPPISKAIQDLKYKFSRPHFNVTDRDIANMNRIIEFYSEVNQRHQNTHKLFIKMFMHEFLRQTFIKGKDTHQAIDYIEAHIISKSLDEHYNSLVDSVSTKRFLELYKELEFNFDKEISYTEENQNNDIKQALGEQLSRTIQGKDFNIEKAKRFIKNVVFDKILDFLKYD